MGALVGAAGRNSRRGWLLILNLLILGWPALAAASGSAKTVGRIAGGCCAHMVGAMIQSAIDGKRRPIFGDLLRRVGELEGIERVRYTSPHPADMTEDVALAMAETQAVCNQMHFPLQSGSKRILSAMRRGYTPDRYLERLAMMRSQHCWK